MEDSPLGIDKWLVAVWLITNCKNGISSYELARDLGITQKSAWFMLHRIRLAMQDGRPTLGGEVEADETFIGGKIGNMSKTRRKRFNALVVMGGQDCRDGPAGAPRPRWAQSKVRGPAFSGPQAPCCAARWSSTSQPVRNVYTDSLPSYMSLNPTTLTAVIDHAESYVGAGPHQRPGELLGAAEAGHQGHLCGVEPFHLFRYLDEQAFTFNNRKLSGRSPFRRHSRSRIWQAIDLRGTDCGLYDVTVRHPT